MLFKLKTFSLVCSIFITDLLSRYKLKDILKEDFAGDNIELSISYTLLKIFDLTIPLSRKYSKKRRIIVFKSYKEFIYSLVS